MADRASEARTGALFALCAFSIWSGFPLYFKLVADIPASEVLGHRILWSLLFVALLLALRGRWQGVREALVTLLWPELPPPPWLRLPRPRRRLLRLLFKEILPFSDPAQPSGDASGQQTASLRAAISSCNFLLIS